MKQVKAKIALIIVFALIISGINIGLKNAQAEDSAVVYGDAISAEAGQEIKVPVLIKENQGVIAGMSIKVTYDVNVMTPLKVEKGEILSKFSNLQFGDTIATSEEAGTFECVAYNDENYSDNGELFILTFQMADSVAAGSYELKLEMTEHFDEKQDDVSVKSENISIVVSDDVISTQEPTTVPGTEKIIYVWEGEWTGWGGPESYPSSANHAQGSGDNNIYWMELTNMAFTVNNPGYGCGLELMNPYNPDFTGAENEMAQFIKKMKNPVIKVTLKNGGAASSWNWNTELSFPSGEEMALPDGYLDAEYFVLFGNDDVITKVEIYDLGESGGAATPAPVPTSKPVVTPKPVVTQEPSSSPDGAGNTGSNGNNSNQNVSPQPTKNTGTSSTGTGSTGSTQSGTKKVKKPAKVTGLSLTWERKKLYVQWNGKYSNSGYQIQCALNRSFTKKKKTKNSKVDLCRFSGLKKKKTYYVRVRAYKKASGRKVYGKWSKVKKIRTK